MNIYAKYADMNIFSNRFEVEFDDNQEAFLIIHPNDPKTMNPPVKIRRETLEEMSFKEASQFIGERLILLMPALSELFKDYLWTEDGRIPPKKR